MATATQDLQPSPWYFTDLTNTFHHRSLGLFLFVIIFSLILLFTFLYFYFHFVRRYSHFSTTHHPNFTSSESQTIAAPPVPPLGLDSAAISNLPVSLHRSVDLEKGGGCDDAVEERHECSICLGLFEDEEVIKVLPKCKHIYHSVCVDKWLRNRSSCPLCRASLQVESPVEHAVLQL